MHGKGSLVCREGHGGPFGLQRVKRDEQANDAECRRNPAVAGAVDRD
jgi:hypothetical protein